MVIGNGDIANVLNVRDNPSVTYFASGVSNSQCDDPKEFQREIDLLKSIKSSHLVYFSSISIYEKDTPYTQHKIHMEAIVRLYFPIYTIIRLGNITWGDNPNTIINYLKRTKTPEIRNEFKHICTLADFYYWIDNIPKFSTEMNITGERVHMVELYNRVKNKRI